MVFLELDTYRRSIFPFSLEISASGIGHFGLKAFTNGLNSDSSARKCCFQAFLVPGLSNTGDFQRLSIFESGRTGLGPFIILILPFAVFGVWQCRKK